MQSDHRARRRSSFRQLVILIAGLLLGGCAHQVSYQYSYQKSEYKPNPPIAETPLVPFSVAVLPFEDATPDWKQKGFFPPTIIFNLTKTYDQNSRSPFIPPERWTRDFAQEVASSGVFAAVNYTEDGRDLRGDILIRGKVLNASRTTFNSYDFTAQFQAIRYSDGKAFWGETVSRQFSSLNGNPVNVSQTLLRSMFGEALADLVKELESRRAEWGAFRGEPAAPASEGGESVEEILRKINKQ